MSAAKGSVPWNAGLADAAPPEPGAMTEQQWRQHISETVMPSPGYGQAEQGATGHNGAVTPNTALYRANLIDPAAPHKDAPSEFFKEVDDDYARSLTRRRTNKVSVPPDELQVHQHVETLTESEQTPAAGKPEDA